MTITDTPQADDLPDVGPKIDPPPAEAVSGADASGADVRYCQLPECPNTLPADAHARRIYCDDHDGRSPERRRVRRQWLKDHNVTPADEPPRVAFEVGRSKGGKAKGEATAAELDAVEARAKQLTKLAALIVMMGPPDELRKADANDLLMHSDSWASTVRELAVHEESIRKLMGAGGEMSERAAAWFAFSVATGAMALPILLRHEVIKGGMANAIRQVLASDAIDAAA